MTDGELSFYYHVSGDIETDLSLSTISELFPSSNRVIYTPTDAGLTFWYHISGNITQELNLNTRHSLSLDRNIKKILPISLNTVSTLDIWKQTRYLCVLNVQTVSSLTAEDILNAGYQDIIQFGSLVLDNAEPDGKREYSFPCAEKRLLDGSRSLHVRGGISYVGKFKFVTREYADIQALFNMVGTLQTLRVYGVPYRNCMVWSPIQVFQPRPQHSRWEVEITVYQDTSKTSITS
jgi:hypothetical protein